MTEILKPVFYGLLYIDEKENAHANLHRNVNPIDIYLGCASLCAASIQFHGFVFRLITNNKKYIEERLAILGKPEMEIIEVAFTLQVPRGIPFYAAHFKLEIYEMFGKGIFGDVVGLIDIDTVMLAPPDFSNFKPNSLLGYDISDQVMGVYGSERIRTDMEIITNTYVKEIRWWGGEFLFGSVECFRMLSNMITVLWPQYLAQIKTFHHVGDEMLVSAALSMPSAPEVMDAGKLNLIVRWWSARTGHYQPAFNSIKNRSILHLPSDKTLLTLPQKGKFNPKEFCKEFEKNLSKKLFYRHILNIVESLLRRKKKYAARL